MGLQGLNGYVSYKNFKCLKTTKFFLSQNLLKNFELKRYFKTLIKNQINNVLSPIENALSELLNNFMFI